MLLGLALTWSYTNPQPWRTRPTRRTTLRRRNSFEREDGTRPVPIVAVDRSWADSDGSLSALAEAEALRLGAGVELGWIEASANLEIELYDVVTVDQTRARVAGIVETWDRGRLMQRLRPAEV